MKPTDVQTLLRQASSVRNACDLDLLAFLWRHPRALLTSDRLAYVLGYSAHQISSSLDAFIELGFLERSRNPTRATRLYCLVLDGPAGEATCRLLEVAADPEGRRAVLRALDGHGPRSEGSEGAVSRRHSLQVVGRRP